MSQGVPEFGVWNDPYAEKFGFTNTFDVVRKVRNDRSSMDHIPIQQTIDANPHLRRGPATNSVTNERMRSERPPIRYDNEEIWETQSAKSTQNSMPTTGQSRILPVSNERRRHDLTPPIRYDNDEIWETQSAKSTENSVPTTRPSRRPPVPNERRRHDLTPPVRYDNGEIWETQSAKSTENSVPTTHLSRRPPAPNERRRHDLTPPVRYDNGENWETQSAKSTENSVPTTRPSRRPPAPNERRRHDLTPAEYQKVLTSQDDPRLHHERPRAAPSPGTTRNALLNSSLETQHHQRPTSSNGSSRDLPSSREEEFMAKATYQKPKGPTALAFGKWNADPNCTQEYTREFAAVRHKKENSVSEPANNNPAAQSYYNPALQSHYNPAQQSYHMEKNPQPKRNKGTKKGCLDCLFPRVKTYERWP